MIIAEDQPARPLRLGDTAPNFSARSTRGMIRLSDYHGRWLMFFSHPADFTPVCSTEFVEIARRQDDFDALGCALLGLSVDSLYSHIAWVKALHDVFGVTVNFPVLEDPSMVIGRAYGMIDENSPDSMTMRSTYVIDPEGIVRATTCYPPTVGRSVEEMLRLIKALQVVSSQEGLAPEGWTEGRPLLALAPEGDTDIAAGADWFCHQKEAR